MTKPDPRHLHTCNAWCQDGLHASVLFTPPRGDPHSWWSLTPPVMLNLGAAELVSMEDAVEAGPTPAGVPAHYVAVLARIRFRSELTVGADR